MNYILSIAIDLYQDNLFSKETKYVTQLEELVESFTSKYDFPKENIYKLYNANAKGDTIHEVILELKNKLRESDNLIIIYGGCSFYRQKLKEGYWIPYDAIRNKISTYFPLTTLYVYLQKIKINHFLLLTNSPISSLEDSFFYKNNTLILPLTRYIIATEESSSNTGEFIFPEIVRFVEEVENCSIKKIIKELKEKDNIFITNLNDKDWIFSRKKKYEDKITDKKKNVLVFSNILEKAWEKTVNIDVIEEYRNFLILYPSSPYENAAKERIESLNQKIKKSIKGEKAIQIKINRKKNDEDKSNIIKIRKRTDKPIKNRIKIKVKSKQKNIENEGKVLPLRNGIVLFKIPEQMKIGMDYICEIRIAPAYIKQALLKKKLTKKKEKIKIEKDYIRLSEVMRVELLELLDRDSFTIKALTNKDQIIEENDYTFWKYSIIPFQLGAHKLLVKISALIDDREKNLLVWDKLVRVKRQDILINHRLELLRPMANAQSVKFKLKDLLSQNEISKLFLFLRELFKEIDIELFNQIIQIENRLNRAQLNNKRGLINHTELGIQVNHINEALLSLIDQIEVNDNSLAIKNLKEERGKLKFNI